MWFSNLHGIRFPFVFVSVVHENTMQVLYKLRLKIKKDIKLTNGNVIAVSISYNNLIQFDWPKGRNFVRIYRIRTTARYRPPSLYLSGIPTCKKGALR